MMTQTKGTEIRDKDGKLICRLACDIGHGERIRPEQFTDWQIPIPAISIPRPILTFIRHTAVST